MLYLALLKSRSILLLPVELVGDIGVSRMTPLLPVERGDKGALDKGGDLVVLAATLTLCSLLIAVSDASFRAKGDAARGLAGDGF